MTGEHALLRAFFEVLAEERTAAEATYGTSCPRVRMSLIDRVFHAVGPRAMSLLLEAGTPAATEVPVAETRPRPAVKQGGPSSDRAEPTP